MSTTQTDIRLTLDTYVAFDRLELGGAVILEPEENASLTESVTLRIAGAFDGRLHWLGTVPLRKSETPGEWRFILPLVSLPAGYHRVGLAPDGYRAPSDTVPLVVVGQRSSATLTKAQTGGEGRYLRRVEEVVDHLLVHQSAPLGGQASGPSMITTGDRSCMSYRSLGSKVNGRYNTYWFPEQPMELQPTRLDLDSWSFLDRLAALTGEPRYAQLVDAMADAVAQHGFDTASGLGYFGEEADLDVIELTPRSMGSYDKGKFKPLISASCPTLPLDRLWGHAPQQMARMCRSMFQGLISDPGSMDYNRFCWYGFSDADETPATPQSSSHLAFDATGTRMIHWWSASYARAGDRQCLAWAQRMADKWQAVQHAESGLIPNFFGGRPDLQGEMPPCDWCETRGAAASAAALIDAVNELRDAPAAANLVAQLRQMAVRLANGLARFAYDPQRQVFRETLHLDGRPYEATSRYTFRTQEEKNAAVREDPSLSQVSVYDGCGFYEPGLYASRTTGSNVPLKLAEVAAYTGDQPLIERVGAIAADAVAASRQLTAPFNSQEQFTFAATGNYVRMLLHLHGLTGERHYLNNACEMADAELVRLDQLTCPDWWRLRERGYLLEALLALHVQCQAAD